MLRTNAFAIVLLAMISTVGADVVNPPEGVALTQIHIPFEWDSVPSAGNYQLQVAVDAGVNPFDGPLVVDTTVDALDNRTVVTSGLTFGTGYAWRVRGLDGGPLPWGPTHRFTIDTLPSLPSYTVTQGVGVYEPGYTLFGISNGLALAIDQAGDPVWFQSFPSTLADIRLLPSGRLLVESGGRARFHTTNGQQCWRSPDGPTGGSTHHEASEMPNGNVLAMIRESQQVNGGSTWTADRLVEFDRYTNEVVWSWNQWDYFSTDDFDAGVGSDWTHTNAVIYNPADNSVYTSARHLSRITRIDYDTGDIIYNMGFDMPSGDVDFGDNLFSFQHAVELLPNGNMMLYDNGNRRDHMPQSSATGVSKAIELEFVYDRKTGYPIDASIVWEWEVPYFTPFVGDADRLPGGNTLVNAGAAPEIFEVSPAGDVVWSLVDILTTLIYRAERVAQIALDLPADPDGDGIADMIDNCPDWANPGQHDCDGDGFGDRCAIALGFAVDADGDGIADPCDPSICPGDADASGTVDVNDLLAVILDWGTGGLASGGDVDGSGSVDVGDLVAVILNWGVCP